MSWLTRHARGWCGITVWVLSEFVALIAYWLEALSDWIVPDDYNK